AFAHEGYDIALLARRPERLAAMCGEIHKKTGRLARAYGTDAGDEAALQQAIRQAQNDLGDADVLIYNVASHEPGRPLDVRLDHLLDDFRTNVVGALVAARAVAPGMMTRKRGTILFTGGGFAYE